MTERHIGRYVLKPIGVSPHIDRSHVLANCGKRDSNDNLYSYLSIFTEQKPNETYQSDNPEGILSSNTPAYFKNHTDRYAKKSKCRDNVIPFPMNISGINLWEMA